MEGNEGLPILKKTETGFEAVYEDGNDLPVLKKKKFPNHPRQLVAKLGHPKPLLLEMKRLNCWGLDPPLKQCKN